MKQIILTVTDAKAAELLPIIVIHADELTVTRTGEDPVLIPVLEPIETGPVPPTKRITFRKGDKTSTELVLDMFDDGENSARTIQAIKAHLTSIGFAPNTAHATTSKMVADGLLKRLNKDIYQLVPESERPAAD